VGGEYTLDLKNSGQGCRAEGGRFKIVSRSEGRGEGRKGACLY